MEDIKKSVLERINNRYISGFVIAFVLWNYKSISILIFGKYDLVEKFEYINTIHNNISNLLIYPAISSFVYFLIVPWMTLLSEWYNNIPNYRLEIVRQNYSRKILEIKKEELETKQETVKIQEEIKAQDRTLNQHDITLFEKMNANLDEIFLVNLLETVRNSQRCFMSDLSKIEDYVNLCKLNSNIYINKDLSNLHMEFMDSLSNFLGFIAQHFFVESGSDNNEQILGLYPEMRQDKSFLEHTEKLVNITNEVYKKYSVYRILVKRVLEV